MPGHLPVPSGALGGGADGGRAGSRSVTLHPVGDYNIDGIRMMKEIMITAFCRLRHLRGLTTNPGLSTLLELIDHNFPIFKSCNNLYFPAEGADELS